MRSDYMKRWYAEHAEEQRVKARARYWAKRDENVQRKRDYREANREAVRESDRLYRQRHREEVRERVRAYHAAHPEKVRLYGERKRANSSYGEWMTTYQRRRHLKKKYGMTVDDYRNMLVGQAGRCLICLLVPAGDLQIDHDHATGKVRGLICAYCNKMLGHARDDAARLRRGIAYLERSAGRA